jgi:hypothetical protein
MAGRLLDYDRSALRLPCNAALYDPPCWLTDWAAERDPEVAEVLAAAGFRDRC